MPLAFLRRDAHCTAAVEERVVVHVAKLAAFEALVTRVVDGGAELALAGSPGVPVRFLHHRAATLSPPQRDEALDGTLLAVAGRHGRVREDVVHFVHGPVNTTVEQRRTFVRVETILPVTMVPVRFSRGWLEGATANISAGGALVSGAAGLSEGERLRLLIDLAREAPVDLRAKVIRADPSGLAGLRLEQLDAGQRERLVRWITRYQRAALAELRDR